MTIQYSKANDNCLRITENIENISDISIDSLIAQRDNYISYKADFCANYDRQIAVLNDKINQAISLGIKTQAEISG